MQTVWYENKALVFASADPASDTPSLHIGSGRELNPAKLLQKFDNRNTLYVVSDDPARTLEEFCDTFRRVEAAGGVVENRDGEVLMMMRRGWWDLPKGHVEPGESHPQTALREVEEETGLHGVRLGEPLGTTQHFYRMHSRWEMKRTWWYAMRYDGQAPPVPQTEEDITAIHWLRGEELWRAVAASYGTIREVFDAYVRTK